MFEGSHVSFGSRKITRLGWALALGAALLLPTGCRSVALKVEQPPGARVELYRKAKWFLAFGPDWGTPWTSVSAGVVNPDQPPVMDLEAVGSWLEGVITMFPRRYRACFDLSKAEVYPGTSKNLVEIWRVREVVPPKHQEIVRLWQKGRTLDALTRLPLDVLADVLYNLGGNFRRLLGELTPAEQEKAAKALKAMLEAGEQPSSHEVEVWLKSFLNKEQLDQLCGWVRDGVTLKDIRWVKLGGRPQDKDIPVFWELLQDVMDVFIREPEIRTTTVDFYNDVILRNLLVKTVESRLVHLPAVKVYAEVRTFDCSYFSDRVMPELDLVQGQVKPLEVAVPVKEDAAELLRTGSTTSIRLDPEAHADAVARGLPLLGKGMKVSSIHSQVLGAVLSNELAYVVVWHNPRKTDVDRFLTTVVTTDPYGMSKIWAMRGDDVLCEATATFDEEDATPLGSFVKFIASVLDQRGLFVKLDKPLAVIAFGNRPLAPWASRETAPISRDALKNELAPGATEE